MQPRQPFALVGGFRRGSACTKRSSIASFLGTEPVLAFAMFSVSSKSACKASPVQRHSCFTLEKT